MIRSGRRGSVFRRNLNRRRHRYAQEIAQEVFVLIWSKADNFDPTRGTAIHWVLGITRNRSSDRLRSGQCHSRLVEKMTAETHIPGAVSGLPREQRAAIETACGSDAPLSAEWRTGNAMKFSQPPSPLRLSPPPRGQINLGS